MVYGVWCVGGVWDLWMEDISAELSMVGEPLMASQNLGVGWWSRITPFEIARLDSAVRRGSFGMGQKNGAFSRG